jgi:tetratricopeptide (TPR) repeat protein
MQAIKVLLSFAFVGVSLTCSAQDYFKKGNKAFGKGNHTEALRLFRLALEEDTTDTYVLFNIAETLYRLEDYQGGITVATQAIRLDSSDAAPYFCRAKCYGALENYESAIRDYTTSIKLDPQYFSYFNRGLSKFSLGDWRAAIADFSVVTEKKPTDYEAYLYRGNCYEELGESDRAMADYSRAAALTKKDPQVFLDRGYLAYEMGRLQEAKSDYLAALKLEPGNVEANVTLAELCLITNQYDKAYQFAKTTRKYTKDADYKVVSLIFSCIAGKLTDKDVSNDEMQLDNMLENYLETGWSFDEVRTYLSRAPIDSAKREYSLRFIEQYESHDGYD